MQLSWWKEMWQQSLYIFSILERKSGRGFLCSFFFFTTDYMPCYELVLHHFFSLLSWMQPSNSIWWQISNFGNLLNIFFVHIDQYLFPLAVVDQGLWNRPFDPWHSLQTDPGNFYHWLLLRHGFCCENTREPLAMGLWDSFIPEWLPQLFFCSGAYFDVLL